MEFVNSPACCQSCCSQNPPGESGFGVFGGGLEEFAVHDFEESVFGSGLDEQSVAGFVEEWIDAFLRSEFEGPVADAIKEVSTVPSNSVTVPLICFRLI
jgi:hypothetical protein